MNITSPGTAREALHVDPQEALRREVEIGNTAARLRREGMSYRANLDTDHSPADFERGARAGLTHLWPLLEAARRVEAWNTDVCPVCRFGPWEGEENHMALCPMPDLRAAIEAVLK